MIKRHACGFLPQRLLAPAMLLSQVPAVIRPQNDDSVLDPLGSL